MMEPILFHPKKSIKKILILTTLIFFSYFFVSNLYAVSSVRWDFITGKISSSNPGNHSFELLLANGDIIVVKLTDDTYAKYLPSLNADCFQLPPLPDKNEIPTIWKNRTLSIAGLIYSDKPNEMLGKVLLLAETSDKKFLPESKYWWMEQAQAIADFWINAQGLVAGDSGKVPNAGRYRTKINKIGLPRLDSLQETATISRLIYGLCSTFLIGGDEKALEAAKALVDYQRKFLKVEIDQNKILWLHAYNPDAPEGKRQILASIDGDDYGTIPLYEQIYSLSGLTQYYRITQDAEILTDIEKTLSFMEYYFGDPKLKGFYSHISDAPFTDKNNSDIYLKKKSSLDMVNELNRRKKNWNSIGDHLPAFLFNLYLGTGKPPYREKLNRLAKLIVSHFPDSTSPFVQERFFEDWTYDSNYSWQQDRGVVGHNMKIVWLLTQMHLLTGDDSFLRTSRSIADAMIEHGEDLRRGGWFDVIERHINPQTGRYNHVWHNRKAWWQQEQGILSNYILYIATKDGKYLDSARRGAIFYNYAYPDLFDGGIYFDAQAEGTPFLGDRQRNDKGSHAKAGYHSQELAYYAHLYTNLFLHCRSINLYFHPSHAVKGQTLRVQPIIFPSGSVRIANVKIGGVDYENFNPSSLYVNLPAFTKAQTVLVTLEPVENQCRALGADSVLSSFAAADSIDFFRQYALSNRAWKAFLSQHANMLSKGDYTEHLKENDIIIFSITNKNKFALFALNQGSQPQNTSVSTLGKIGNGISLIDQLDTTYKAQIKNNEIILNLPMKTVRIMLTNTRVRPELELPSFSEELFYTPEIISAQLLGTVNCHRERWNPYLPLNDMQRNPENSNVFQKTIFLSADGGRNADGIFAMRFTVNHDFHRTYKWHSDEGFPSLAESGDSTTSRNIIFRVRENGNYNIVFYPEKSSYSITPDVEFQDNIESMQVNGFLWDDEEGSFETRDDRRTYPIQKWDETRESHNMDKQDDSSWAKEVYLNVKGGMSSRKDGIYQILFSANHIGDWGFCAVNNQPGILAEGCSYDGKPGRLVDSDIVFRVSKNGLYRLTMNPNTHTFRIEPDVEILNRPKSYQLNGPVVCNPWDPTDPCHDMTRDASGVWKKRIFLSSKGGPGQNGVYSINISINDEWLLDSLGFGAWILDGNEEKTRARLWHTKPQEPNLLFQVTNTGFYEISFYPGLNELTIEPGVETEVGIREVSITGDIFDSQTMNWNPYVKEGKMESTDGIRFTKRIPLTKGKMYSYKYVINNAGHLWSFADYVFDGYKELSSHGNPPALTFTAEKSQCYTFEVDMVTGMYDVYPCLAIPEKTTHSAKK